MYEGKSIFVDNTPPDERDAFLYLRESCHGGEDFGCMLVAIMEIKGIGTKVNTRKGIETLKKYCYDKDSSACFHLGFFYELGAPDLSSDIRKAMKYFSLACDIDPDSGCSTLGRIYFEGEGIPQDYVKAYPLLKRACGDVDDFESCYYLGLMYRDGLGIKQDEQKGYDILRKVCKDYVHEESCRASGLPSTLPHGREDYVPEDEGDLSE